MTDKLPTLEETNRDIEITERELKAYDQIAKGFYALAQLPDQLPGNVPKYMMQGRQYEQKSVSCAEALQSMINYKKRLEIESK